MQVRYFCHTCSSTCLSSTQRYLMRSVGFQKITKLWEQNQNKNETRNVTYLSLLQDQIFCETVQKQCKNVDKNMEIFLKIHCNSSINSRIHQSNMEVAQPQGYIHPILSLHLMTPEKKTRSLLVQQQKKEQVHDISKRKDFLCVSSSRQHLKNSWHISL